MQETAAREKGMTLNDWLAGLPAVFLSNTKTTADISQAARIGLVRKVGPRLYTAVRRTPLESVVRANALRVAALRCPGSVLSHRTAFEMVPHEGYLFLTGDHERTDRLPGLTIRIIKGVGPQPGDMEVMGLFRSSTSRALLENLRRTRRGSGPCRALSRLDIEEILEKELLSRGEAHLNQIRDEARPLSSVLGAEEAFATLDQLVSSLLVTRESVLSAPIAVARAQGKPYDENRLDLLEGLASELRKEKWRECSRPVEGLLREARQNLAFVDAYFSNFIEGTKFGISEAQDIVFSDEIPMARPKDAHDVKGTFDLLIDRTEMGVSLSNFDAFEDFEHLLKRRHQVMLGARPEIDPGEYKTVANRAGMTSFVAPELVQGTLAHGFTIFKTLDTPFQRAAFIMFLVSEVHPFNDGNGRLARAMMNAELVSGDESCILIVTSYRTDYLGALRLLSRKAQPIVYLRMLDRAQEFTSRLSFSNLDELILTLESCNAFDDTDLRIMKLPPRADSTEE